MRESPSLRLLVMLALLSLVGGCFGVKPYTFTDSETFVRPGGDVTRYKRAAVLYIGYTAASPLVQRDASAQAQPAQPAGGSQVASPESSTLATDVVLYSNALINALATRGVMMVERNRVNDLIREQGLIQQELLDLSDVEKIRRLGKLLKVDLLIRGAIIAESGGWMISFKGELYYAALIGLSVIGVDTRTGEVVWIDTTYIAQRIPPKQAARQPDATGTSTVIKAVDAMVARFLAGGAS